MNAKELRVAAEIAEATGWEITYVGVEHSFLSDDVLVLHLREPKKKGKG